MPVRSTAIAATPSPRRRGSVRPLLAAQRQAGVGRGTVPGLIVTSVFASLAEASLLIVLVSMAVSIGAGDHDIRARLPGMVLVLSRREAFALAGLAVVLRGALQATGAWLIARANTIVVRHQERLACELFLDASWSLQADEREGHLVQLTTVNVARAGQAIFLLGAAILAAVNFGTLLVSALALEPRVVLLLGAAVAALALALRPLILATRRSSSEQAQAGLDFAGAVSEMVGLALEVRTLHVGRAVGERISASIEDVVRPYYRMRLLAGLQPVLYQSSAFATILAGVAVVALLGGSEQADLAATVLLLFRALQQSGQLQSTYQALSELTPYVDQFEERIAEYRESAPSGGRLPCPHIAQVSFDAVSFAYDDHPVLDELTFDIAAGEIIGIAGRSGAGKSTLMQLLLRLRDPSGGRYLLNGQPVGDIDLESWYERTGVVPQESRLFSGTVEENIAFFRPITPERVREAARLARIADEIESWPLGYATPVGERGGAKLSGGQRQRISLARALAAHPEILVLDEPTSALDARSELLVRETLRSLAGEVTVLIVAHRRSTLSVCDRIMVIDRGRLAGFDTPERIIAAGLLGDDALVEGAELPDTSTDPV
jgi:ABC-type multidrug transport system fused ATPase/permease subunit